MVCGVAPLCWNYISFGLISLLVKLWKIFFIKFSRQLILLTVWVLPFSFFKEGWPDYPWWIHNSPNCYFVFKVKIRFFVTPVTCVSFIHYSIQIEMSVIRKPDFFKDFIGFFNPFSEHKGLSISLCLRYCIINILNSFK